MTRLHLAAGRGYSSTTESQSYETFYIHMPSVREALRSMALETVLLDGVRQGG